MSPSPRRNKICTQCITALYKFYYRETSENSFQPGTAGPFHRLYEAKHVPLNKTLYIIPVPSRLGCADLCLLSPPSLHVCHLVSERSNPDHFNNVCLDAALFVVMKAPRVCHRLSFLLSGRRRGGGGGFTRRSTSEIPIGYL